MNFKISIIGDVATVYMMENAVRSDFGKIISELDSAKGIKEVALDLKDLYYIKSETLSELISIKKWCGKSIKTSLLNVNDNIYQVLEVTNLVKLFDIRKNFGSYSAEELIAMFQDVEMADVVSEYMAGANYSEYREKLLDNLGNGDSVTQEYCILTIGRAYDFASTEIIRNCLDSEYPNVVRAAILVLGWMGDMECKERIYSFLSSEFEEIAEAAGASISLLSDDSDVRRLGGLVKNAEPFMRSVIAGTLSMINGREAFDLISGLLADEKDEKVRTTLVRRVSFFNIPEATQTLIKMLDDPSMAVQEAAASGLARTGLRGNEDIILKKITSEDKWMSFFAVKALGTQYSEKSARFLLDIYGKSENNVKLAILEVLAYSKAPETGSFLVSCLNDANEDIRKEALAALNLFDGRKAVSEAKKLAFSDSYWGVRYKAVEILAESKPEGYLELLKKVAAEDDNKYVQEKVESTLGE